jgi:hypothetical protein
LAGAALLGCEPGPGEPLPVSYLAVVSLLETPVGPAPGTKYRYHVTELSGTLGVDTVVEAAPDDTVILRLEPATYTVEVRGLPPFCDSRHGRTQRVAVVDPPSTSLARYYLYCKAGLMLTTATDGAQADDGYVYEVAREGDSARIGLLRAADTTYVLGLPAGPHTVRLRHVASNCVVTSNGGERQVVEVLAQGGAAADFRVECSDPARRPVMLDFASSYRDGASAFYARVADPDGNIERYAWDLTDCHGTSVLPGGARIRRGLSGGRTAGIDTIELVGAFEPGLAAVELVGRCTALRVMDEFGNTTPVFQDPIGGEPGSPPTIQSFNAVLRGTTAIVVTLQADDPDGDLAGTFAAARLRDGILGLPDGNPDFGIYNAAGYLGTILPELPVGTSRIRYDDVLSVIVYLIDRRGNVRRLEDADTFR